MNCNKRQVKSLTATILIFAMLLLNCFSAFAATVIPAEYQDIEIRPYSWYPSYTQIWKTDSHRIVAIKDQGSNRVALRTYDAANDRWIQTTCGDGGFVYGIYNTHTEDKLELTATPSIVKNGTGFEMKIGIKNTGVASASDFKVYIGADTMLDGNDASVNTPSADHLTITMEANGYAMEIGGEAKNGFKIFPTSYRNYCGLSRNQDPATIQEVTTLCDSAFVGYWVFTTENEVGPGKSVELSFGTDVGGGFNPVADIIWEEYKQYYLYGESLVTTANAYAVGEDPSEEPTKSEIVWDFGGFNPTRSGNYTITATVKGGLGTQVVEKEVKDVDYVKTFSVTVYDAQRPVSGSTGVGAALYTGTWGAPVTDGTWSQAADGSWSYTSTQPFRSTWGYIRNPYAKGGQATDGWFYFDANGKMLTGWQQIDGKWYFLNNTSDGTLGMCYLNTLTPDKYRVDEKGAAMKDANGNWIRK